MSTMPWIEWFKEKHEKSDINKQYCWSQVSGLLNYIDERELLIQDLREQREVLKKDIEFFQSRKRINDEIKRELISLNDDRIKAIFTKLRV